MNVVVGLNHGSHDAAAAVVIDGQLRVMVEQERVSLRRYAEGEHSTYALLRALADVGLTLSDVDAVALGSDHNELAEVLGLNPDEVLITLPYDPEPWLRTAGLPISTSVTIVPHHLAHAHSAFWPSAFDSAAVLVIDAMGESSSASIGVATRRDGVHIEPRLSVDESLGFFYEAACAFVGFGRHSAGKLMGLAAYGRPHGVLADTAAADVMRSLPSLEGFGRQRIRAREEQLLELFATHYFPYVTGSGREPMAYVDFAASAQRSLEIAVVRLALEALGRADARNLVMAGGVALNCSANGRVARELGEGRLFVQPASIDSGVALGAALAQSDSTERNTCEPVDFDPFVGCGDTVLEASAAARRNCSPPIARSARSSTTFRARPDRTSVWSGPSGSPNLSVSWRLVTGSWRR